MATSYSREPWEAPLEVMIDKGTTVVDRVGHEVGVVDDVLVETASGRPESLVIRRGGPRAQTVTCWRSAPPWAGT